MKKNTYIILFLYPLCFTFGDMKKSYIKDDNKLSLSIHSLGATKDKYTLKIESKATNIKKILPFLSQSIDSYKEFVKSQGREFNKIECIYFPSLEEGDVSSAISNVFIEIKNNKISNQNANLLIKKALQGTNFYKEFSKALAVYKFKVLDINFENIHSISLDEGPQKTPSLTCLAVYLTVQYNSNNSQANQLSTSDAKKKE